MSNERGENDNSSARSYKLKTLRLMQRLLRGERLDEHGSARDRSRSVCVTSFPTKPTRDVSAIKIFQRRASSAITSATDLISRRGVFSRRYYGSVEKLQPSDADGTTQGRQFRIENGRSQGERDELFGSPNAPVVENPEYQTRWYFKFYLGKLHQSYVGLDAQKNPFFLSVAISENDECVPLYRAILFKKTGAQKLALPYNIHKPLSVKQILVHFPCMDKVEKGPKEIWSVDVQKDLLLLEEQEGSVNFKFGVIYAKYGQTTDDEILSNECGSQKFDILLKLLGERVRLRGWNNYRGGLDVKGDMTGRHSIYTVFEGHEIMFHVSTMLPYSKENKQQVERKRHIGNDIINIVFIDCEDEEAEEAHANFNPTSIKSQFTHVFALITLDSKNEYRLSVFVDDAVPLFGPSLPCPPVFGDQKAFREFLLVKLINGEKATFESPTFAKKRERTLDMLIKDLYQEHMPDGKPAMNRRAFSDVLADTPRHSRLKEDARLIEFVRVGQALKLEAIVRGDAPTSLASTSSTGFAFRRSPWEAHCFYPVFPQKPIICADSWCESKLIIGTEEGIFLVEEGVLHRQLFDKTLQAKQINVIEQHGILLIRTGQSKDGRLYVFRLSQIDAITETKTAKDVKENRMESLRGIHLYAISRTGGAKLWMCAAVGKKIVMFQWKHSAAWTAWCSANDTDTVDGFTFVWDVALTEHPTMLTLLECSWNSITPSQPDMMACVGYKHHWELVNGRQGYSRPFHHPEGPKPHLLTALDLYEDQQVKLMLCYNNTAHFKRVHCPQEEASTSQTSGSTANASSNTVDFHFNSVPVAVACAFPYVIGLTPESMEIRLIVNGNLVHNMTMPKLQLVSCKNDIFFATTAPEFVSARNGRILLDVKSMEQAKYTSSTSPGTSSVPPESRPLRIYRIPLHVLSRTETGEERSGPRADDGAIAGPSWAPNEVGLVVPQVRVSRSATNSPTPTSRVTPNPPKSKKN